MKKVISIFLCVIFVFSTIGAGAAAANADNPSAWTTQQIVEYYKLAASRSDGTSRGVYNIEFGGSLGAVLSGISNQLAKNPEHYDGITGNFSKLSASDIKSASARLDGSYIVVDLQAKEQTYNAGDTSRDGSVTRLVDSKDYGVIIDEDDLFEELTGEYNYSNAYAKDIKINIATGKIESGKWGYDLCADLSFKKGGIRFNDLTFEAAYTVEYPFTPTTINSVDFPEEISVRYKDTVTLTPTVDATNENYNVSYDCSDYNVINITSKGEVETYKRGTSVVTCTVEGEGGNTVQKDCKVNVYYSRGQWFIMIFLLGWLWY